MATNSERTDNTVKTNISDDADKKKKEDEEEAKKVQSLSTDGKQNDKTTKTIDDLNHIGKTDTLSSVQSTNEDEKSDPISLTSDTNKEKKNEEKTVETTTTTTTTQQKEKSGTTPVSSISNNNEDSKNSDDNTKNEKSVSQFAAFNSNQDKKKDNDNAFPIEKDDGQYLTDFQCQKAKYFFNVNLDIENKEYVTWDDVEFYLLFHVTAAGKEGSDGGDLEARLSRAARAFWEHVHDQVPLPDGKRDKLTLNQFLDTWASLIDYVLQTNRLPPIIKDLVKLGFELYSTDNGDAKSATIQPQAFDQLFQKMNLGRPYAIMAYKYLTDNGTKPLDADKIDSIIKAVITSSDDEHDSHFLLPGFFKTISNNQNNEKDDKNKPPSPVQDKDQSEVSGKSSPTPKSSSPPPSTPTSPLEPQPPTPISPPQPQPSTPTSPPQPQPSTPTSPPQPQPSTPTSPPQPQPSTPTSPPQPQPSTPTSPPQPQPSTPTSPPQLQPSTPTSPPQPQPSNESSSSQPQQSNVSSSTPPQEQQKPSEQTSSSQSQQQNGPPSSSPKEKKPDSPPSIQKQSSSTSQHEVGKSPTCASSTKQQQQQQDVSPPPPAPKPEKARLQQEDENIRRLLRFYHIDDGDIVEITGGSVQRLVLVHPERPLPPYIQQNKQLLQKLQSDPTDVSSVQQNGFNTASNNEKSSPETKPKVTLEERVSRGEAQKGPTIPLHQEQKQENSSSTGVRQVYPQLSEAQQEEQRRQAKLQATQPANDQKQTTEETSAANDVSSSSKQDEIKQTKDVTREEEQKIVAAVLKQLTPIVEKRVAAELRRIQSGETDQDEDDHVIQFPFMLGGGFPFFAAPRGGPPPQGSREHQQTFQQDASGQGQQQVNGHRGVDFGGLPVDPSLFPPQLIMAMMNDLARGGMGGEMPGYPPNMPPPHHGPAGVEGFMMFVDDDQLMGGLPGYPPHPGPRF